MENEVGPFELYSISLMLFAVTAGGFSRIYGGHLISADIINQLVSRRQFCILVVTGTISYGLQIAVLFNVTESIVYHHLVFFAASLILFYLMVVTSPRFTKKFGPSEREVFANYLWAHAVFPLVLLALPEFIRIFELKLEF